MAAADEEGLREIKSWPEIRGNGVAFADLPPFLCWTGIADGHHLVLLQPRELGSIVPGARKSTLPGTWLKDLDLESLARPLRRHPSFPGGAAVHVVRVPRAGEAQVRSKGPSAPALIVEVLFRLSGIGPWRLRTEDPLDL
jgi:hypothetical protein